MAYNKRQQRPPPSTNSDEVGWKGAEKTTMQSLILPDPKSSSVIRYQTAHLINKEWRVSHLNVFGIIRKKSREGVRSYQRHPGR